MNETQNDESVLTLAIAESYLQSQDSVDLSAFSQIDDDAATCLSRSHLYLKLNGLTQITDFAAQMLGNHSGMLALNGLAELPESVAESLSKHANWRERLESELHRLEAQTRVR
jgi:hypothetical protein